MIKKYMPYAITIFAVFLIVPLLFINKTMENFFPIALYIVFPGTTIACSAIYCSKHGLDFLFALIAPMAFLLTMIIYCGGFKLTNVILLAVYLVSGIFGLFMGDVTFGDKRRQQEKKDLPRPLPGKCSGLDYPVRYPRTLCRKGWRRSMRPPDLPEAG